MGSKPRKRRRSEKELDNLSGDSIPGGLSDPRHKKAHWHKNCWNILEESPKKRAGADREAYTSFTA